MNLDDKKDLLLKRLSENLQNYQTGLFLKDRRELIDSAAEIAAVTAVCSRLQERNYTEQELGYLLQFQNPLEVICDFRESLGVPMDGLNGLVADMAEKQIGVDLYSPVSDRKPAEDLRKFINVDLIGSMKAILDQVTFYYKSDFDTDQRLIRAAAQSDAPERRNLLWLCRKSGTFLHQERDVFIRDTSSFNNIQFYHRDCKSEHPKLYGIEITGVRNGVVRGNLYERDLHQYAEFAKRVNSLYADETLCFSGGQEVRLPFQDYDAAKVKALESKFGPVLETRHEPEDESVVQFALRQEHKQRDALPRAYLSTHIQKLEERRIQNEAEQIVSDFQRQSEIPGKKELSVSVPFSVLRDTEGYDLGYLSARVLDMLVGKPLYFVGIQKKDDRYVFKGQTGREQTRKPSIRAQLAENTAQKEQSQKSAPVQQKDHKKDKGAR